MLGGYLQPGAVLNNRYEIVREIGRGGHSVVYAALDRTIEDEVAIKLLVPPPALADAARRRLRKEVQTVRGLTHENIVAVHDYLEHDGTSYIIMELVENGDLMAAIEEHGPLPPERVARLGNDIGMALMAAHDGGVLHRDVKPQNILLSANGVARLADFGSAKIDGQTSTTHTHSFGGTLDYIAPEVLAGQRGDARGDLYALGVTMYFALSKQLPPRSSLHLPPTPEPDGFHPILVRPDVPVWLDSIIARATAAKPSDRFPTAARFIDAIQRRDASAVVPNGARGRYACPICDGPEPLGIGLCTSCGGANNRTGDTLVFINPPSNRNDRGVLRDAVLSIVGRATPSRQIDDLVNGYRPIVRIGAAAADHVSEALAKRNIHSTALTHHQTWRRIPVSLLGLAVGVMACGLLLGGSIPPLFGWSGVIVGTLLIVGATMATQSPAVRRAVPKHPLPPQLHERVVSTLSTLPNGPARHLLSDVVRAARALRSTVAAGYGEQASGGHVDQLIQASCDAAQDLAVLDETLTVLEPMQHDLINRCEQTRDALVQRLLDAITVLGRATTESVASNESAQTELSQFTEDVRIHFEAYASAVREVEQLLAPVAA